MTDVHADGASARTNSNDLAWFATEIAIRTCVEVCGYDKDSETADWVVADMKRRHIPVHANRMDRDGLMSIEAAEAADWISDRYRALLGEWMLEMVRLGCELWQARVQLLELSGRSDQ